MFSKLKDWFSIPSSSKELEWMLTKEGRKCNCGSQLPINKCNSKSTYCG